MASFLSPQTFPDWRQSGEWARDATERTTLTVSVATRKTDHYFTLAVPSSPPVCVEFLNVWQRASPSLPPGHGSSPPSDVLNEQRKHFKPWLRQWSSGLKLVTSSCCCCSTAHLQGVTMYALRPPQAASPTTNTRYGTEMRKKNPKVFLWPEILVFSTCSSSWRPFIKCPGGSFRFCLPRVADTRMTPKLTQLLL